MPARRLLMSRCHGLAASGRGSRCPCLCECILQCTVAAWALIPGWVSKKHQHLDFAKFFQSSPVQSPDLSGIWSLLIHGLAVHSQQLQPEVLYYPEASYLLCKKLLLTASVFVLHPLPTALQTHTRTSEMRPGIPPATLAASGGAPTALLHVPLRFYPPVTTQRAWAWKSWVFQREALEGQQWSLRAVRRTQGTSH